MYVYNKNLDKQYITSKDIIKPVDSDYEIGYINRYFFKSLFNEFEDVYELSEKNYYKFKDSTIYKHVVVKWYLTGEKNAVSEKNSKNIEKSIKFIPEILYLLTDKNEFYK